VEFPGQVSLEINSYRFAELVFPKLLLNETTGTSAGPARNAGPFGEAIGNVASPSRLRLTAG
jgi:hypothetical protein